MSGLLLCPDLKIPEHVSEWMLWGILVMILKLKQALAAYSQFQVMCQVQCQATESMAVIWSRLSAPIRLYMEEDWLEVDSQKLQVDDKPKGSGTEENICSPSLLSASLGSNAQQLERLICWRERERPEQNTFLWGDHRPQEKNTWSPSYCDATKEYSL